MPSTSAVARASAVLLLGGVLLSCNKDQTNPFLPPAQTVPIPASASLIFTSSAWTTRSGAPREVFAVNLDGTGLTESVLVDVDVDDQGRMVDYQIVSGQSVVSDPAKRRRVESLLWFTRFTPATSFGMPMAGRTRVRLMPSPWILNVQRADWPGIYVKG